MDHSGRGDEGHASLGLRDLVNYTKQISVVSGRHDGVAQSLKANTTGHDVVASCIEQKLTENMKRRYLGAPGPHASAGLCLPHLIANPQGFERVYFLQVPLSQLLLTPSFFYHCESFIVSLLARASVRAALLTRPETSSVRRKFSSDKKQGSGLKLDEPNGQEVKRGEDNYQCL